MRKETFGTKKQSFSQNGSEAASLPSYIMQLIVTFNNASKLYKVCSYIFPLNCFYMS